MATITGADYKEDKYRTLITNPPDNQLNGDVIITLHDAPIGQPNFVKGQEVIIKEAQTGVQTLLGTVGIGYGPTKYQILGLV